MGNRYADAPRTVDLVLNEPLGQLSPTVLRGIRHDLRQPQHVFSLLMRTLRLRAAGSAFAEDVADLANAAHLLIERYESALLAIGASIDAPVARSASVGVATVLESVAHSMRGAAEDAGIALRVAHTRLWAYTDPGILGRIVGNLLANAIAHSGASTVLLGARSQSGRLVIHVLDDGIGVAADELALLAQPGYRGRSAASPGLGLGLYNVELLARALGGTLRLRSTPGRGTRARVRTASFCGRAAEVARCSAAPPLLAGRRIIVVSGDPVTRQAISHALTRMGATVADYPDVISPALELPYWKVAPDGFILDGHSSSDEAFVKGLQLRFGSLRGVQIVPAGGAADVLPLEVLTLAAPLTEHAYARIAAWFVSEDASASAE